MEQADTLIDHRYILCRMNGEEIERLVRSNDLAELATEINYGPSDAWYLVADRSDDARIADKDAQWSPTLEAHMVAFFAYRKFEVAKSLGRGNGRSLSGRFTPNVRFGHMNPMTAEKIEQHIDHFYDRLSAVAEPAAAVS